MDTITNQKPEKIKDPRRVESGKRLAAISKDAKKAKKDRETAEQQTSHDDDERSNLNFGYVVGTIGVITGVGALYFAYQQNESQDTSPPPPPPPPQHTTCSNEYFD